MICNIFYNIQHSLSYSRFILDIDCFKIADLIEKYIWIILKLWHTSLLQFFKLKSPFGSFSC